jgi:hypothetical protein
MYLQKVISKKLKVTDGKEQDTELDRDQLVRDTNPRIWIRTGTHQNVTDQEH